MRKFQIILLSIAMACAGPALADKDKGKGPKHKEDRSAAEHAPGHGDKHGPPTFSGGERDAISAYYHRNPEHLPPGLAKQGKVPPGWQKKLARGRPVPDDIWALRVPLPHEILIKLPPPPPGVVIVRVHDRILKVREQTHELLDEMGLPHPP